MSETLGTSSRPAAAPLARAAPGSIDVSIVIVSYNSGELLERCLASLERATGRLHTEVLVVDNASRDDSVARARARFPSVRLVPRDRNYGFASSVNVGMRMAGGRVILWLNPDCELSADSMAALVDTLDARPEIGVVGPAIAWPGGALQPAAQAFPSPLRLVFRSLGVRRLGEIGWVRALLRRIVPRGARMVRGYLDALEPGTEPKDADWITGACFATRSDVVAKVGGLDEAFFMYCEDTDYCQRVRAAGWAVHYLPAVRILHVGGASSEHNPLTDFYHRESLLLYFARYARAFWMVRAWYLLSCGGHGLAATVASWFGASRPERWWRLCALALASREALRVRRYSEYPAQ